MSDNLHRWIFIFTIKSKSFPFKMIHNEFHDLNESEKTIIFPFSQHFYFFSRLQSQTKKQLNSIALIVYKNKIPIINQVYL